MVDFPSIGNERFSSKGLAEYRLATKSYPQGNLQAILPDSAGESSSAIEIFIKLPDSTFENTLMQAYLLALEISVGVLQATEEDASRQEILDNTEQSPPLFYADRERLIGAIAGALSYDDITSERQQAIAFLIDDLKDRLFGEHLDLAISTYRFGIDNENFPGFVTVWVGAFCIILVEKKYDL